jgi:hypothetical protein
MSGLQLPLGFLLNFFVALLIIRGIYYPVRRSKEYVFTFLTLNTGVFLISSLLGGVDLSAWALALACLPFSRCFATARIPFRCAR